MDEVVVLYLNDLEVSLRKIDLDERTNSIEKAQLKAEESLLIINKLKVDILKHTFLNSHEEINFFKVHKPKFYSRLYYFKMVQKYESHKPIGSEINIREYIIKELGKLKSYFDINNEFYTYFRNNSNHLDNLYFIRENLDNNLIDDYHIYDADQNFCTSHDYKVSRLISMDYYQTFLDKKLLELDTTNSPIDSINIESKLEWTESKADLTELIYALYSLGVFNHGNADLKQIASFLAKMFNIDIGDFYHTYKEIKERKKGITKFLDKLKSAFISRTELLFEN